jgi:hypothetical protein
LLLDASGSMNVRRDETIREVNHYLYKLRNDGLKYRLTVRTFNEGTNTLILDKDIKDVGLLEHEEYRPNGWTRLLDAVGDTLEAAPYHGLYASRTLFVVVTDGQENDSRRYGLQQVRDMIDRRRSEDFQFVFLGDGPQAWQVGNRLGFNISVATDWSSPVNTENIYRSLYKATNASASGQTLQANVFNTNSTNATNTTPDNSPFDNGSNAPKFPPKSRS